MELNVTHCNAGSAPHLWNTGFDWIRKKKLKILFSVTNGDLWNFVVSLQFVQESIPNRRRKDHEEYLIVNCLETKKDS